MPRTPVALGRARWWAQKLDTVELSDMGDRLLLTRALQPTIYSNFFVFSREEGSSNHDNPVTVPLGLGAGSLSQ
jgi:hypothetical protein